MLGDEEMEVPFIDLVTSVPVTHTEILEPDTDNEADVGHAQMPCLKFQTESTM